MKIEVLFWDGWIGATFCNGQQLYAMMHVSEKGFATPLPAGAVMEDMVVMTKREFNGLHKQILHKKGRKR